MQSPFFFRAKRALFFLLPVIFYYSMHFMHPLIKSNHISTGFIQYDQPSYIANSLEYTKAEDFHIAFSMPYLEKQQKSPIYFFPQLFLIGNLARIPFLSPTIIFLTFGFVFAFFAIVKILELVELMTPNLNNSAQLILQLIAVWGGGILFSTGFIYSLLQSSGDLAWTMKNCFQLDPGEGFWMLNIGRNFIYPMESYYHFLFITTILYVYKKSYINASLVASLLIISHPFTGTIIATGLGLFLLTQFIRVQSKQTFIPLAIVSSTYLLLLAYNFYWLPLNPAHKQLLEQWKIDWSGKPYQFILAYLLVLIPAFLSIKNTQIKNNPFLVFLLCWLFTNLLLENHQYFIHPAHQPLHFSHGYVWFCLFLISFPWLSSIVYKSTKFTRFALLFILLLDNTSWFALYSSKQLVNGDVYLTKEERMSLKFLSQQNNSYTVISPYDKLGYFNIVYNNHPSYISHRFNTPNFFEKQKTLVEISKGKINSFNTNDSINRFPKPAYWIFKHTDSINQLYLFKNKVYTNDTFVVYLLN